MTQDLAPQGDLSQKTVPSDLTTLLQQVFEHHQKGRLTQARAGYEQILSEQPQHADALHLLGVVAIQTQNYSQAVQWIGQAIQANPKAPAFHANLGCALHELKQYEAALAAHDQAIALQPDFADAYTNRGNALRQLKQWQAALESYDKVLQLRPDHAQAHANRGVALRQLGQWQQALESYDTAIRLAPKEAGAYNRRGNVQKDLMQLEAALASYDQAIALDPNFANAYFNKSLLLLLMGDFAQAWPLYESRWTQPSLRAAKRDIAQPLWLGDASIQGKTILLHAEQGLGDTIQFCRYAKWVQALHARVVMEVPAPLVPLLQDLEGVALLVAKGQALPAFDYHCPLMSLPLAFKTQMGTIPSASSYLSSDPQRVQQWSDKLGPKTQPRVGLVWCGSTVHDDDHTRSLTLAQLLAYLPADIDYVSLQKEVRHADQVVLQAHPDIRHLGDQLQDFADTAAVCALMDVVISVDTSVAHLSAALGQPTWILLSHVPDWRWLLAREDSPWYPSAKLYRQTQRRAWAEVLTQVRADLIRRFKSVSDAQKTAPHASNARHSGRLPARFRLEPPPSC